MSEQDRRQAQAIGILESNEKRDFSRFNQGLVISALATLQGINSELYDEWIERIARVMTIGTGQVIPQEELRNVVDAIATSDADIRRGTQAGVEQIQDTPEEERGGLIADFTPLSEFPPDPGDDDTLPPLLGGITDEETRLGLEPSAKQRQLGISAGTLEPYRQGDQFDFAPLGSTRIQAEQRRLQRAGLLEKGEYTPGFWDIPTSQAMAVAMGFGNQGQVTFRQVLDQLALLKPKKSDLGDPAPLFPDPASIAQDVKATFRQRLGREPTASELRELGAALGGFETQSLEQQAELAATGRIAPEFTSAIVAGAPISGGKVATPGTPVIVDPIARFLELFDKRFGPEEARNRRVVDVANQRRSVMSSLTTMQALIEGG